MTITKTQVLALLKENRNERGIAHWKKKPRRLKSFGIGLTQLRKLAKQIGRDHKLAQQLWKSDVYDAKVIGLLIDDPKQFSREQAEKQVEELNAGMLAHVFASCDATPPITDAIECISPPPQRQNSWIVSSLISGQSLVFHTSAAISSWITIGMRRLRAARYMGVQT